MNNNSKIIAGGCSFTYGHELSDCRLGKEPSKKNWANLLKTSTAMPDRIVYADFVNVSWPGTGNSGIARRVFEEVSKHKPRHVAGVLIMWSFLSRYDWAMDSHDKLEKGRWVSISPWDTNAGNEQAFRTIAGSETQTEHWKTRKDIFKETGTRDFAEAIYKYGANQYHELYLSWKSIIWLQNILQKKKIPYMFTIADNSLFYDVFEQHKDKDPLLESLWNEIDFTNWFFFGERNMGFNQWATLNDYPRGTTHPLDEAHRDAVKLMLPMGKRIITAERQGKED